MEDLKIGMIGTDSSHCIEFTKLLNDPDHPFHVKGGRIHSVYPFYSENLPISKNRFSAIRETLEKQYLIQIADSIHLLAKESDAILITSIDGSMHLNLFREILSYKKPVFIDKPLSLSIDDAKEIFSLSLQHQVPVMSSSALRFAESFYKNSIKYQREITGIYVHGPLPIEEQIPGYYWYGIHMVEMVIAAMGTNVSEVSVHKNNLYEIIVLGWQDGRQAIIRGEYQWHPRFGVTLHTNHGYINAEIDKDIIPFYSTLLKYVVRFFKTKKSPISQDETLEIINLCSEINMRRELNLN